MQRGIVFRQSICNTNKLRVITMFAVNRRVMRIIVFANVGEFFAAPPPFLRRPCSQKKNCHVAAREGCVGSLIILFGEYWGARPPNAPVFSSHPCKKKEASCHHHVCNKARGGLSGSFCVRIGGLRPLQRPAFFKPSMPARQGIPDR